MVLVINRLQSSGVVVADKGNSFPAKNMTIGNSAFPNIFPHEMCGPGNLCRANRLICFETQYVVVNQISEIENNPQSGKQEVGTSY